VAAGHVIVVEDDLQPLLDLLWVREAWNLSPVVLDLPPLLVDDSGRAQGKTATCDESTAWSDEWSSLRERCVYHASLIGDSALLRAVVWFTDGSPERAELLQTMMGPSWRDDFGGRSSFTKRNETWTLARPKLLCLDVRRGPWSERQLERISLDALIPA
jgi:hypothetical protein